MYSFIARIWKSIPRDLRRKVRSWAGKKEAFVRTLFKKDTPWDADLTGSVACTVVTKVID